MFNNIGSKIKGYAEFTTWIGIIISVVIGAIILFTSSLVGGLVIALVGSLVSWISSIFLYGFGQLVENSDIIVKTIAPNHADSDNEKIVQISKQEMEKINNEYSDNWGEAIRSLSDEELIERMNSQEWQYEYRVLCKKELNSRGM